MPRLHTPTALPHHHEKPLPAPPGPVSPTLTNPDFILPATHSPPRLMRRPPSPSYLRDDHSSPHATMAKKEKNHLGLMSRKMMLLRSRTASGGINGKNSPRAGPNSPGFIPSSPILQDVGNLAPELPETDFLQLPEADRQSNSGGSSASDMSGLTNFLARYAKPEGTSDDEALFEAEDDGASVRFPSNATVAEEELDEERRKQQEEEYNSAILSKRAEQILANAKKRLNVMEGNLRGARDLVAPLTAANLKRATSLGSAQYTPSYTRKYAGDGYESQDQQSPRKLTTQASSPSMGRDYQGHARGFSENDMPERPYTALDRPHARVPRNVRTPAPRSDPAQALRVSKSHDSLGASSGVGYGIGRDRPLHARDSPDLSHLETLQESDDERRSYYYGPNDIEDYNNGLGIYRPSSRTSDLREQMSSLKGKISTLKERAREDSLRRHSQANLKHASPFNNALATAPEFFYTSAPNYGSPVLDANAGVGYTSNHSDSPASPQNMWENGRPITGSRNAFAEEAALQKRQSPQRSGAANGTSQTPPVSKFQAQSPQRDQLQSLQTHKRTASGTAIVEAAKNRYSHHQRNESQDSQDMPGAYVDDVDYLDVPSPGVAPNEPHYDSTSSSDPAPRSEYSYAPSEDGNSVYEDATSVYEDAQSVQEDTEDEGSVVVPHEEREDAFDYEQFFLHSAMVTYGNGRRGSASSEVSVSSVETAKGPALVGHENDDDDFTGAFPPPTPETPERLRQIERNLHSRAFSDTSVTTVNTFATAAEDPISPIDESVKTFGFEGRRSVSPIENAARAHSRAKSEESSRSDPRPTSRPGTAVRRHARADSSSDRADSGVGLPRRSIGSANAEPSRLPPSTTSTIPTSKQTAAPSLLPSPPTSPNMFSRQDPVAIAVNALLDPNGKQLGLRNKAVLFGVVESLRKVVQQLQVEDEAHFEARGLRRKLDEAKLALDGRNPG